MRLRNTTEAYCLNCLKRFYLSPIRERIERKPLLCPECLKNRRKERKKRRLFATPILFLSKYDGQRKERLMKFKEYGDIVLGEAFLYYFLPWIRLFCRSSIIVPLPSSDKRNRKRGFVHLEERLKPHSLPFLSCLRKQSDKEQKEKKAIERREEKSIFFCGNKEDIEGKKIVLFDDVLTTGATFLQSLDELKQLHPKSIKGLILMDNHKYEEKLTD